MGGGGGVIENKEIKKGHRCRGENGEGKGEGGGDLVYFKYGRENIRTVVYYTM